jgi:two-component system, chemotaxis family, protein-glutamate methylesterase/glutaminase
MKVLIVDDSIVFRTQISSSLNGIEGIEVVGTAANGRIALQKLEQISIDLVVLDMEMPELNGLDTLKALRAKGFKTKVVVFSSQTPRGAEKALDALSAGADDIVAKPSGESVSFETAQEIIRGALVPRVLQFMHPNSAPINRPQSSGELTIIRPKLPRRKISHFTPKAIVIASSTGGPAALESIFSGLKGPFRIPIFIAQHMPPVFTQIMAKRLAELTGSEVKEASQGELVTKGVVYVAPGDFHMVLKSADSRIRITLNQDPLRNSVRPAADHLFESAAGIYGPDLAGIVLTGMGEDGAVGAKNIRELGGRVLIQNKESCVVFGMPGAVYANDDFDEIGDLQMINQNLRKVIL